MIEEPGSPFLVQCSKCFTPQYIYIPNILKCLKVKFLCKCGHDLTLEYDKRIEQIKEFNKNHKILWDFISQYEEKDVLKISLIKLMDLYHEVLIL